ncbi:MAG: hypothetical protein ABI672_08740 [Vicinamibacteria bacterium]
MVEQIADFDNASSTFGTPSSAFGRSYTAIQLNAFLSRFLANQPVAQAVSSAPAVSSAMTQPRRTVMLKPIVKTLSFSAFALLVATSASALDQSAAPRFASMAIEASMATCSSQADIERGWEYQQELLEARLAAKGQPEVTVPGTIITSPFETFVPYRAEASSNSASKTQVIERSANLF